MAKSDDKITLLSILKDSKHNLTIFTPEEITTLEKKIIVKKGKPKLDKYGHLIVDRDLHNHNGELPDGIAEAFIDWAKKEKLSFWRE